MVNITKKKSEQAVSSEVKAAKARNSSSLGRMKSLLLTHNESIEDKVLTLKIAQLVDSGRFQTAFKTLMKR
tara:strand:- start:76 stop:288 length:213 start_codon:yes stop_codon:yes gene_type:complete